MKKLWLIAFLLICGCENGINPPPKIEVEINDNTDHTTVTVHYRHHSGGSNPYEELKTPEELAEYKKQVDFLLDRLDEAENRMKVHEPNEKEQ